MFRCQKCQCIVPPRTPANRIVLKGRTKKYPFRSKANIVSGSLTKKKNSKKEFRDDPGGEGYETEKEAIVCPECAAKRNAQG